jgi:hypothetical protein
MLVERGIQIIDFEAVGDAYAIASNYFRKTGAIADSLVTDERLLEIIVKLFQHGLTASPASPNSGEVHGSRDRPHHADL